MGESLRSRGLRLTRPRRIIREVRFLGNTELAGKLGSLTDVTLVVDHPNERTRTVLSPETKRSLSHDLA